MNEISPHTAAQRIVVEGFDVEVDRAEVIRLLGRSGRPAEVSARVGALLDQMLVASRQCLVPRGVYVLAAGKDLPGSSVFSHLERMAFCVCTIGPELEAQVAELTRRDELAAAVVLDAVGSAAAEATADCLEQRIRQEAGPGLQVSCRASPGYGDWDVREQRSIFALVPAAQIGVRLSESCMMIPRKSVSFAVHIAPQPENLRGERSCRNCDRTKCSYRR